MRWLIVEDALRDRKGHWFEYVRTFLKGLRQLGDSVTVLGSKEAEPFILTELEAKPVLPESIWHRMSDGAPAWKRYLRVPWHAFKTWRSLRSVLKTDEEYDLIFVPTVSVHHLLGWVGIIKKSLKGRRTRVVLYFLSTPIRMRNDGTPEWVKSPTTWLLAKLLASLRAEVEAGKVVIGVETVALQNALSQVAGIPVRYLPQPVELLVNHPSARQDKLLLACYGAARHEKGSDLLQSAIVDYLQAHPQSHVRFAIQWVEDFGNDSGQVASKNPGLLKNDRVEFITHYFGDGEYLGRLSQTAVLLLPYRLSSYRLRGSRVVIEAMVNGIPVVATRGTTLAQQAEEFGAVVMCGDGDVASLVTAMETVERDYKTLAGLARQRQQLAQEHFSVINFRRLLDANSSGLAAHKR